jgi:hypothetical protein
MENRSWTLAVLMEGGSFHLALGTAKEEKWKCEKTLRVLLSSMKWTKTCCGLSLAKKKGH